MTKRMKVQNEHHRSRIAWFPILMLLAWLCVLVPLAIADTAVEERSYSTRWTEHGDTYRSIMFPHEIDGCKVMIQAKYFSYDGRPAIVEKEGPDCNCDLVIDGHEEIFRPAKGYSANRLSAVCHGPAVDGSTRRLAIMRETLKEHRNFSHLDNVQGF